MLRQIVREILTVQHRPDSGQIVGQNDQALLALHPLQRYLNLRPKAAGPKTVRVRVDEELRLAGVVAGVFLVGDHHLAGRPDLQEGAAR